MNCNMRQQRQSQIVQDAPWKEWAVKAGLTGGIAAVSAAVLFQSDSINLMGVTVPAAAVIGLGAAGGSVVADLAHQYVLPHIPGNEKLADKEAALLSVVASGLGSYAATRLIGNSGFAIIPTVGVGAGSFLAGDYVYHHVLSQAGTLAARR